MAANRRGSGRLEGQFSIAEMGGNRAQKLGTAPRTLDLIPNSKPARKQGY